MIWKSLLELCKVYLGSFDENRVVDYPCNSCLVSSQRRMSFFDILDISLPIQAIFCGREQFVILKSPLEP